MSARTARDGNGPMISTEASAGARILLVEDDAANRALVRAIVSRGAEPELRGACLVEANDLAQARAALAGGPVDVLLLDMGLPDGNGMELAAELRNSRRGRPPAVVAVTGDASAQQADAAIAAGCQAVLAKPYTAADLRALLASLLRRGRDAAGTRRIPAERSGGSARADQVGCLFGDHDGRGVGVPPGHGGHDGGVHHAQCFQAEHP